MTSLVEHMTFEQAYDRRTQTPTSRRVTEYFQTETLPCQPGFQSLEWSQGEVFLFPVLFWSVCTSWRPMVDPDVMVLPVTQDGAITNPSILYPDGKVYEYEQVWPSLALWIEERKKKDALKQPQEKEGAEAKQN
jgi:hypothetical protein